MNEDIKKLVGKHVHIKLKDNYFYSGHINLVTDKWILLIDKEYKPVYLLIDSVISIEEYNKNKGEENAN